MNLFKSTIPPNVSDNTPAHKPVFFQPKLTVNQPNDVYEQEADKMADHVMGKGDSSGNVASFFRPAADGLQRKCQACEEEESKVHRKESSTGTAQGGMELDNYVGSLGSSGQNLPQDSKQFFESKFGHDFSNVKLHTDSVAAKSAQSINALAYTSGNNIVFNSGQYSPESEGGKRLIAHELTHVVQQNKGGSPNIQKLDCPKDAKAPPTVGKDVKNDIDSRAQAIIDRAKDTTVDISTRATRAVSDIVCAYYPEQAAKVKSIKYDSKEPGLSTAQVGTGASAQGEINVGDNFINHMDPVYFARRVLQTGHELDHIGQYRGGLTGSGNRNEREFLAFYHNAMAQEFEGTRHMADSMRKSIIDQSLGYYYCFDDPLKKKHDSEFHDLLTKRETVNGTKGNAKTDPPTSCKKED